MQPQATMHIVCTLLFFDCYSISVLHAATGHHAKSLFDELSLTITDHVFR
ncbi:hypothetical protein HanRHA438_Chr17g0840521 [Helianthus annuus]|nr:hypothetical protein HanRHA438_Chr17g0840521 [Helianthus annuus]